MPTLPGLVGGSYQGRSFAAVGERSKNFFPERIDSANGQKADAVLMGRPGLKRFVVLANASSVAAECEINGRAFTVASGGFYEVLANGTAITYGPVAAGRAQMVASQSQVLILAGGMGYTFALATNTLTQITDPDFPVNPARAAISDSYFLVLEQGTQNVAFSALNDGTSWDALDFANAQGEPGNIVSIIVDHRQLWLLSSTHAEIYYDSGDATNPWTRLEGAFSEQGCGAVDSAVKVDNTIMWLGSNPNGGGMVWRMNGYTPQRASTHAIESIWQSYPTIADASGYCYQEDGHTFYRLDFPSANQGLGATWVYDVSTALWHERTYFQNGIEQADLGRTYMYAFGKHLVGDYQSGTIYEQSMDYATDDGAVIRGERTFPSAANGGKLTFYSTLRLLMDVGVGLDAAADGPGADPQIVLELSDDGGRTWFGNYSRSIGRIGEYGKLIQWDQLGSSRNRSWRITITEPVRRCLISAEVDAYAV